ncbi:MAG: hypothetical protein KF800_08090 [Lysobacter sp.]|nr:hypothetical protein [Lysobacter sp.]
MAWPFDSEAQLDEWVEAYIAAHREQPTTDQQRADAALASEPAYSAFGVGNPQAEAIWRFILKVVAKQPSDWTLGMLAAGPIEDLIGECGDDFIDRIEAAARRDPIFRRTLHGVWRTTSSEDVWARVMAARGLEEEP